MRSFFAALCIGVFVFNGCATIFHGTDSSVRMLSQPDGADVYVNGVLMGKTPVKIQLEGKKSHTIEFRKEGYESKIYQIPNHIMAGYIVLDIILGFVPLIVDAITGAWYELDEHLVDTSLHKKSI